MAWNRMQRDFERFQSEEGQFDMIVDDEIRSGRKAKGRQKIVELRAQAEAAVDSGVVEEALLDMVDSLLGAVENTAKSLAADARKFPDPQLMMDSAEDYLDLATSLENLLNVLEAANLTLVSGILAEIDERVAAIDARLVETGGAPPPEPEGEVRSGFGMG